MLQLYHNFKIHFCTIKACWPYMYLRDLSILRYFRFSSDIPQTPDYLKCKNGKYYKDIGQRPSCNPFAQSCPAGFSCRGGPADQPGFCCKSEYDSCTVLIPWIILRQAINSGTCNYKDTSKYQFCFVTIKIFKYHLRINRFKSSVEFHKMEKI
jgi:hypothetical protein